MSKATEYLHDPELGILGEIEQELIGELSRLDAAPERPAKELRSRSVRITRRALILVALVSLVGSSALAASIVLGGSRSRARSLRPEVLATGAAGGQGWQLQTYVFHGTTCFALFSGTTVASLCDAEPGRDTLKAISTLAGGSRLVAGLAGVDVVDVRVKVARRMKLVPTHQPPLNGAVHAGSPTRPRWFVAILPAASNLGNAAPALLSALGRDDRRLGPPLLDCSLGGTSSLCQNAASRIAAGELGSD